MQTSFLCSKSGGHLVAAIVFGMCYVPGVTRKELGNQNLVFEKSAKSTFKI